MLKLNGLLTAFLCLLLLACIRETGDGTELSGGVTKVRDGDTIEVRGVPIRLSGVTCDERGTVRGSSATRAMTALIAGQTLRCSLTGARSYDREIGRCRLPDGRDIGTELILSGKCGRCNRYDQKGYYAAAQRKAGPYEGTIPNYCRT